MVDTPIGTNSPNYTLQPTDVDATIFCRVTATNAAGSASAFSNVVGPVAAAGVSPPVNSVAPSIGPATTTQGTTYSVISHGTWSGSPTFTRQWKSDAADVGDGSTSYTTVVGDVTKTITCVVTATNAGGSANATSNSVGPVTAAGGGAAFTLVSSTSVAGPGPITTPAINTTGADLFVIGMNTAPGATPTITDSKGNSWTALTSYAAGGTQSVIIYSAPTSVGTGHTFTATGTGFYGTLNLAAFSGAAATPFDLETLGGEVSSGTTVSGNSIAPTQPNSLIIANMCFGAGALVSVSGGFTMVNSVNFGSGDHLGGALAYLVTSVPVVADPVWTIDAAGGMTSATASFKSDVAVVGTPPANTTLPLITYTTTTVGSTVNCDSGAWTGDATITYQHQWQTAGTPNVDIQGATASSHVLAGSAGTQFLCRVTALNAAGATRAVSSNVVTIT